MVVTADSHMGMFLPSDISCRILDFMDGKIEFPFIKRNELSATFYIFGKDHGVRKEIELLAVTDLAKRTMEQLTRDLKTYHLMPIKLDTEFIRENYIRRGLQISIESEKRSSSDGSETRKQISRDPTILSSCFAQHIAYYRQNYFFELYKPFRRDELPFSLHSKLKSRMLLLGFNIETEASLPYESAISPFMKWMEHYG